MPSRYFERRAHQPDHESPLCLFLWASQGIVSAGAGLHSQAASGIRRSSDPRWGMLAPLATLWEFFIAESVSNSALISVATLLSLICYSLSFEARCSEVSYLKHWGGRWSAFESETCAVVSSHCSCYPNCSSDLRNWPLEVLLRASPDQTCELDGPKRNKPAQYTG